MQITIILIKQRLNMLMKLQLNYIKQADFHTIITITITTSTTTTNHINQNTHNVDEMRWN